MRPPFLSRKSPIQIALLSLGARGPISVTEVRQILENHFKEHEWVPHRGVIYPALRKLHEQGLIVISDQHGLKQYYTSPRGLTELVRLTKQFLVRLDQQVEFVLLTIENFIDMDPSTALEILERFQGGLTRFLERIKGLKEKASNAEQEWIDIKLEDD